MTSVPTPPAIDRGLQAFHDAFGHAPRFISRAPGRVNLIGEHLDYNGGSVLPIAIDRDCVCLARASDADRVTVRTLQAGSASDQVWSFSIRGGLAGLKSLLDHPGPEGCRTGDWRSYVLGVFHEIADEIARSTPAAQIPALELMIASDVPLGAGLSSSAALEVSVAQAVAAAMGTHIDPVRLATRCRDAEHRFAGSRCGLMDQLASTISRQDHATHLDFATDPPRPSWIPFPDSATMLVTDTGVRHHVSGGGYRSKVEGCTRAAQALGVAALALIPSDNHPGLDRLPSELRPLVRHVVSENRRVAAAVVALQSADLATLGRLMSESHASLRDDFGVSCPELDVAVNAAHTVRGVWGARMTGAGFGGSAIALLPPSAVDHACTAIRSAFLHRFGYEPALFATRPGPGASLTTP